jgi:hypothetical protein
MARAQDSSTLRARWQVGKPTAIFDQASHSRMLQIHEIIMQGIDAALRKRSYPSVESGQRATMPLRPLNERNVRTARGGVWTHAQVGAILHPFGGVSAAVA